MSYFAHLWVTQSNYPGHIFDSNHLCNGERSLTQTRKTSVAFITHRNGASKKSQLMILKYFDNKCFAKNECRYLMAKNFNEINDRCVLIVCSLV